MPQSLRRHLGVSQEQGWTDAQVVTALALLNLAGGECVADMKVLEKDGGLGRVLRLAETHGMRLRERRDTLGRWRKERRRSVPSASSVFRFLDRFHDEEEEPSPRVERLGIGKAFGMLDRALNRRASRRDRQGVVRR